MASFAKVVPLGAADAKIEEIPVCKSDSGVMALGTCALHPYSVSRRNSVNRIRSNSYVPRNEAQIAENVREELKQWTGTLWPEFDDSILFKSMAEWRRGSGRLPYCYDENQGIVPWTELMGQYLMKQAYAVLASLPFLVTLILGAMVIPPGCDDAALNGTAYDILLWSVVMLAATAGVGFDLDNFYRNWRTIFVFWAGRFTIPAFVLHTLHVQFIGANHSATALLCSNFVLAIVLYPALDVAALNCGCEENRPMYNVVYEGIWMKPGARWETLREVGAMVLSVCSVLAPLAFMILDSAIFVQLAADSEANWFVHFALRPLLSMVFRIFAVALSHVCVRMLQTTHVRIYFPAAVYWTNGVMNARGAANCGSYRELLVYIGTDWAILALRLFLFYDKRNHFFHGTRLPGAAFVAWFLVPFGAPAGPPPEAFQHFYLLQHIELLDVKKQHPREKFQALATYVHSIFHLLLNQMASSSTLIMFLVFYPSLYLLGASDVMWNYFYPLKRESFYFVLITFILDQTQDVVSHFFIAERSGYSFAAMSRKEFVLPIMACIGTVVWLPLLMASAGWAFEQDGIMKD